MRQEEASAIVNGLFEEWAPFLLRYSVRMTGSLECADDLVQEVFLAFYRALRQGKRVDDPKAWTLGAARNQIRKRARYLRSHAVDLEPSEVLDLLPAHPAWPDVAAGFDGSASLDLSVLSVREKETLLLRLQSLKYREIADRLGISTKSVCTLLMRALKKLRDASPSPGTGERLRTPVTCEVSDALP